MDKSIFTDKKIKPSEADLEQALGSTCEFWSSIKEFVQEKYPGAKEEWSFPGEKYGWGFRIKDARRVIVYLLPRDKFFKVAFVFGHKATDQIMKSSINDQIKQDLSSAKVYAEGRGIRIDVAGAAIVKDIKTLIGIKLDN